MSTDAEPASLAADVMAITDEIRGEVFNPKVRAAVAAFIELLNDYDDAGPATAFEVGAMAATLAVAAARRGPPEMRRAFVMAITALSLPAAVAP